MRNLIVILVIALTGCAGAGLTVKQQGEMPYDSRNKVLFIGIDGCRADMLTPENAPNIHALLSNEQTAYSLNALNEPITMSGPNWTTLLTGVHLDKHSVSGNGFFTPALKKYPSLIHLLESTYSDVSTASIVHWKPINKNIIGPAADIALETEDQGVMERAVELLKSDDVPDFTFLHFDDVDGAGHGNGYGPDVEAYREAVSITDKYVGEVLQALHSRVAPDPENWLVLITTDHGGLNKGHSGGGQIPVIRRVFAVVYGRAVDNAGEIDETVQLVDLPVTAMAHMGITRAYFDGRVIAIDAQAISRND